MTPIGHLTASRPFCRGIVVAAGGVALAAGLIGFGPRVSANQVAAVDPQFSTADLTDGLGPVPGSVALSSPASIPSVPAPGTYRQRVQTTSAGAAEGGSRTTDNTQSLAVSRTSNGPSGDVVEQTVHSSLGGAQSTQQAWSPAGISDLSFDFQGQTCRPNPPLLEVPFPLSADRSWTSRTSCRLSFSFGGFSGTLGNLSVTEVVRGLIAGSRTVDVGGATVQAWVLQEVSTFTETGRIEGHALDNVTTTRTNELFAPAFGMPVYTTSASTTKSSNGTSKTTSTTTLLSTTPEGG